MIYRFAEFELDLARRELRKGGSPRHLQPQALSVLAYLVRHRDRAVSKAELLETLWPGAVVGEGSLQRAISLARAALEDRGERIRTVARHGYRFVAPVEEIEPVSADASPTFRPRFARSGDVRIAYHTIGEGEIDVVLVPGWAFPMRAYLSHPVPRELVRELSLRGRVILFDKRGTGMSDPVKDLPDLERRMDDLRAVLDAAGSRRAVLVGYSEGGPLSLLFATTYPERVRGLLLVGSFARWGTAADYPFGWTSDVVQRLREYIDRAWGAGATITAIAESRRDDPAVEAWGARSEQEGASPGAALELLEMNLQIDVRALLPMVPVPTVVLHHTGDSVTDLQNSTYLADHIPGARLVVREGVDHVFLFEGTHHLREAIDWLLAQDATHKSERFLSTVLIVESGVADPSRQLAATVTRHRGTPTGIPDAYCFDGPGRAIECAHAVVATLASAGLEARCGVHTGEVVRDGPRLEGDAIEVARAIARAADHAEVLVSKVVRDLVHGSSLRFEEYGRIELADGRDLPLLRSAPR